MFARTWLWLAACFLSVPAWAGGPAPAAPPTLADQFVEFFARLLSPWGFPARWHCGHWTSFHGWLYIVSDLMIWAAYFAIPFLLINFIRQRRDMPFNRLFWLFGLFIFACGATHLLDALIFWVPVYRLSGLVRLITALASWGTVLALFGVIPKALLLKTPTELESIVQARTTELAATNQQLQDVAAQLRQQNATLARTNRDLDTFVYTASHDLKQPVLNLSGLLEELTRTATFAEPEAGPMLKMVDASLNQLLGTIQSLAEVVQVQRPAHLLPPEPVELQPLVEEVLRNVQNLHPNTATWTLALANIPALHLEPATLRSVLYNLLSNAVKYADPTRPAQIEVRTEWQHGQPTLVVQDNGLGIDLTRHGTELFKLFRRFHDHIPGTGLGLYLVQRQLEQAGGHLEVESEVGKGSTFRVVLPAPTRPGPGSAPTQ
ncbi:HAMP domain-containing histidine kinase [Hymenobacter lutimineralis]|uniref:histidine kinase n=1 Tax=Hymenobacter lutimineralis TaxID=2606448 RepID=A0A5D6UU94_9BACT|nr:HAMP domain-containing sensor histidine kinase [Hymenobacter lutimineralis]TYZ06222.1 HAMP domain-containing histidine kinase [Hymenobacter lutimineralis]